MKYYIDSEFDGHNGPLLSFAIIREDAKSLYLIVDNKAEDPWVQENVIPILGNHNAHRMRCVSSNQVGMWFRDFLAGDESPVIIADSPVDITRFTGAITTGEDGNWIPTGFSKMTFLVDNVDCYPTELEGAIQHNAFWDAMALRHLLMRRDIPIKPVRYDFPDASDVWLFPAQKGLVDYFVFDMKHSRHEPISTVNDGQVVKMHFAQPIFGYVLATERPLGKTT